MALHGEIKVNNHNIGFWEAQRAGIIKHTGEYVYRCTVIREDNKGYTDRRRFFVAHQFRDGALALTAKIMITATEQFAMPEKSDSVAAQEFYLSRDLVPPAWAF